MTWQQAVADDRDAVAKVRQRVVERSTGTGEDYVAIDDLKIVAATLLLLAQVGGEIDRRERRYLELERALTDD